MVLIRGETYQHSYSKIRRLPSFLPYTYMLYWGYMPCMSLLGIFNWSRLYCLLSKVFYIRLWTLSDHWFLYFCSLNAKTMEHPFSYLLLTATKIHRLRPHVYTGHCEFELSLQGLNYMLYSRVTQGKWGVFSASTHHTRRVFFISRPSPIKKINACVVNT